jgi:hypothetical protein
MSWFDTLKMHCGTKQKIDDDFEKTKGIARQLRYGVYKPNYPTEEPKDAKKQGIKHQIRRGQ